MGESQLSEVEGQGEFIGDPWDTEDEFGLMKVFGKSSNKYNHAAPLSFRVDPGFFKRVNKLADNPITPHKSVSEFLRDAVTRLVVQWEPFIDDPSLKAWVNAEKRKARMDDELDDIDSAEDILTHHREKLEKALNSGNTARLMLLIGYTEDDAESLIKPFDGQMRALAEEYRGRLRALGNEKG